MVFVQPLWGCGGCGRFSLPRTAPSACTGLFMFIASGDRCIRIRLKQSFLIIRSTLNLKEFVIVADSGLMTKENIAELEQNGYKYIVGARIKNENKAVTDWILSQNKL
jgi:hypothetical protein